MAATDASLKIIDHFSTCKLWLVLICRRLNIFMGDIFIRYSLLYEKARNLIVSKKRPLHNSLPVTPVSTEYKKKPVGNHGLRIF